MEQQPQIGMIVRCLNNKIGRFVSAAAGREFGDAATAVHGWVVRYLYDNRDRDIFQRDLESRFSVRRSTMTSILQLMEKKGLIVKESVASDARLKKLILTPTAIDIQERMRREIALLEEQMRKDLSDEEIAAFLAVAEKIGNNLTT